MNWFLNVLKQYVNFSGRARRQEYWMFVLINLLVSLAIMALDYALGLSFMGSGPISMIYSLLVLLPSLAVSVRRLHDIGKSGAWILIAFIPLVGAIWLIVLFATAGVTGENKYGADPKATVA